MNNLTKQQLIDRVIELEKENLSLREEMKQKNRTFQDLYNSNKTKKEQNMELRTENRLIKKKNMELSILLDTMLKQKRKKDER